VAVEELGDDICTERERHAAIILSPSLLVRLRIRPKDVTKQPFVRHLGRPGGVTDTDGGGRG